MKEWIIIRVHITQTPIIKSTETEWHLERFGAKLW